jgi:hypothetical protein
MLRLVGLVERIGAEHIHHTIPQGVEVFQQS